MKAFVLIMLLANGNGVGINESPNPFLTESGCKSTAEQIKEKSEQEDLEVLCVERKVYK